tara:strand:+ start:166 stop:306 length:141 start_codon:yes stop_codon:yes gene_type:complete
MQTNVWLELLKKSISLTRQEKGRLLNKNKNKNIYINKNININLFII